MTNILCGCCVIFLPRVDSLAFTRADSLCWFLIQLDPQCAVALIKIDHVVCVAMNEKFVMYERLTTTGYKYPLPRPGRHPFTYRQKARMREYEIKQFSCSNSFTLTLSRWERGLIRQR